MAEPFADIMTAFLAQATITGYFRSIKRQHVMEPIKDAKVTPMLALWVTDNTVDDDAGDGEDVDAANYTLVAVKKLEAHAVDDRTQHQDEATAELAGVIKEAARLFAYDAGGIVAGAEARDWFVDEAEGSRESKLVWIEIGLTIRYETK